MRTHPAHEPARVALTLDVQDNVCLGRGLVPLCLVLCSGRLGLERIRGGSIVSTVVCEQVLIVLSVAALRAGRPSLNESGALAVARVAAQHRARRAAALKEGGRA